MNIKVELEKSERRAVRWFKAMFVSFIAIGIGIIVWCVADSENMESPFRALEFALCLVGFISISGTIIESERYSQLEMKANDKDNIKE